MKFLSHWFSRLKSSWFCLSLSWKVHEDVWYALCPACKQDNGSDDLGQAGYRCCACGAVFDFNDKGKCVVKHG